MQHMCIKKFPLDFLYKMSTSLEVAKENFSAAFAKVRDALIWCGGGNSQIVHSLAPQSMDVFVGLGSIVVLVSVIATVAATMAANLAFTQSPAHLLPTVLENFSPWLAVLAGLIYGLLIFSIDRFLVATCPTLFEITQSKSWLGSLKLIFTIILRVAVSMLIAHLIALLLSLVLAQQELVQAAKTDWIENRLGEQRRAEAILTDQMQETKKAVESLQEAHKNIDKKFPSKTLADDEKYTQLLNKSSQLEKEIQELKKDKKTNKKQIEEKEKILKSMPGELKNQKAIFNTQSEQLKQIEKKAFDASLAAIDGKNRELSVLQEKYNKWIKDKKDFTSLSEDFEKQASESIAGKSASPIGIFTLIHQLETPKILTDKNIPSELSNKKEAIYKEPRQLIERTLVAIELLALILKVFSNRGDYARRYAEWEQDHIDQKEDSDRISEQNRAQKLMLDAEAELIQYEQEKKKETQKFINSCEEELEIHSHESQTFRRVCKEAIDHVARNWSNLSPNSESIPSAYGLHQNFKYASDRQASHNPLPVHDVVPRACSEPCQ